MHGTVIPLLAAFLTVFSPLATSIHSVLKYLHSWSFSSKQTKRLHMCENTHPHACTYIHNCWHKHLHYGVCLSVQIILLHLTMKCLLFWSVLIIKTLKIFRHPNSKYTFQNIKSNNKIYEVMMHFLRFS